MAIAHASLTPSSQTDNLRGSLYMVTAMGGFAVNDMLVKAVAHTLNLGQTLLIRGCFATAAVFLLTLYMGQLRNPVILLRSAVLLRSAAEAIATLAFVHAVFNMPIANVSAIYQVLPLVLTLFAALVLGETVGWRRYLAISIGFLGVLIIIRPGLDGFSHYSVWVLVSVAASVVRDLATRTIPKDVPGLMITMSTAATVTLSGLGLALFQEWRPVSLHDFVALSGTTLFLVPGYYFVVSAMRTGDVGFVQPFRYSMLLFVMVGGAVFYDEIPDRWTLLGAAMVVASGIYTLYRERIVHRQKITQPPVRS